MKLSFCIFKSLYKRVQFKKGMRCKFNITMHRSEEITQIFSEMSHISIYRYLHLFQNGYIDKYNRMSPAKIKPTIPLKTRQVTQQNGGVYSIPTNIKYLDWKLPIVSREIIPKG